ATGRRAEATPRAPLAEKPLEVPVPDVACVVIPRDDDERLALEPVEVLLRLHVLGFESEGRQVTGADDQVGLEVVDLCDRTLHQVGNEVGPAAVQVGDVSDRKAIPGGHARESKASGAAASHTRGASE